MPRRKNSNFISIHTSLTPENHALLVKAAASMGMTLGDFLSVAALDKAHMLSSEKVLPPSQPTPAPVLDLSDHKPEDKIDRLVSAIERFLRSPEGT